MELPIETWLRHRGSAESNFQCILRRKRSLNVVHFSVLMSELQAKCRDETVLAELRRSYGVARSLPPKCLAAVFMHPSFNYWSKITQRLLPFLSGGQEIPSHLTDHLRGVAGAEADPLCFHLADINRFLIAAALMAGAEVSLPCPVHDGWLSLPGLGSRVACAEVGMVQVTSYGIPSRSFRFGVGPPINLNSLLTECGEREEGFLCCDRLEVLPIVNGSAGTIFLDPWDPYFRNVWHKNTFPGGVHVFDVAGTELKQWQETIRESLGLLQTVWPEMEAEISALVHTIVPVNSPIGGMNYSCSSDDFWGAILCSFDPASILAEVLVHEFGHILLFELLEIHGVFAKDSPKESDYYSPWRPDPRPLLGLLHAVYTFALVAEYYRRMLRRAPSNTGFRERYSLILGKLERGIRVLAESAKFNATGTVFFDSLVRSIRCQRESGEWISTEAIETSLDEHLSIWKQRHPAHRTPLFCSVGSG